MQYLNDDMDELYRRAAEEYPLKTDSADWNAVVKKILAREPEKTEAKQTNNYKWLLMLVFLLPGLWLGNDYLNRLPDQYGNILPKEKSSNKIPSTLTDVQVPANATPVNGLITLHHNSTLSKKSIPMISDANDQKPDAQKEHLNDQPVSNKKDDHVLQSPSGINEQNSKEKNIDPAELKSNNEKIAVNTTVNENEKPDAVPPTNKNKKRKKENGIYIGLTAGPDISTVKFQSIKKTGFTKAIVLGYQFNKKISVESGIAWDKKYYYSDGKYFSVKNVTLPSYAKITKLDGQCKMIEVPVTIRYNIASSSKGNVSVSAGISSYIMKNENYTYTLERNGAIYPRKASYDNSSTDLLAVATAGISYQHRLGKSMAIRLEPSVKIPLKGVGIGSIPVTSAGINIGIIKKLSK